MEKTIAVLPGDGIGEEVCREALRVLDAISTKFGHSFTTVHGLIGGAAYDKHQSHFPDETKAICEKSDAILFGSVGGPTEHSNEPKWKDCEKNSILSLRKTFGFNANFRPARVWGELRDICPLKDSVIGEGIDMLIVRELLGDIYFGEHKQETRNGVRSAVDTAEYSEAQIESVARLAFEAALKRGKELVSVDKANVLETSRLWREVVNEVSVDFPEVSLKHMYVDNAAMQLIRDPKAFDVVVTANLFGDILSDAAAVLPGSLGLMPSASLNPEGFGMYEPQGGSAPELEGKDLANPVAQILSLAMLLRFSFSLTKEADAIQTAVSQTIAAGYRTGDIHTEGAKLVGTRKFTDEVLASFSG